MSIKRKILLFLKESEDKLSRLTRIKTIARAYKSLTFGSIIEIVYVFLFLLFTAGVINSLLEGNNPSYASQLIVRGLRVQNMLETFLYLFSGLIGTGGIYLMYISKKQAEKRVENIFLLLGITILFLSVFISLYLVEVKLGRL